MGVEIQCGRNSESSSVQKDEGIEKERKSGIADSGRPG